MNIIIFDFEVFKYDTLLGCLIVSDKEEIKQFWSLDEIKQFYIEHSEDIWIGHNNYSYDNVILTEIMNGRNPKIVNDDIIKRNIRRHYSIPKYTYDIMANSYKPFSLKMTELLTGNSIHISEIDFDIDRTLTEEEKQLVEKYNADDLKQTFLNFEKMFDLFKLRLDIISEFNLPLTNLSVTGTKLAANVLKSYHDDSLEFLKIDAKLYDNLILENEDLKKFYLEEKFRTTEKLKIYVGNAEIQVGSGGIHSAIKKYHSKKCMYFDVSGYYNLIMINNDLLPRTMNEESKQKYVYMYHEQLRLKKVNPVKRGLYKTILLSVFGAMMNKYTDFYDPWKGLLVTITGQLYLVDLLEKLKDLVLIVQTNTDGIIVEPFNWEDEPKVISIVEEWEKRTGFVIKKEHVYNLWQRDVNCYFCFDENNKVIYKGEAVKNYDISDSSFANGNLFGCKEPPVIAQGIINKLLFNIEPEDFVNNNKEDLILFQYICRKNTYDYLTYDTNLNNVQASTKIADIARCFALKPEFGINMIYKHKFSKGKENIAKVSNLPESVFVYNDNLDDMTNENKYKIDYNYYVNRIKERILEFLNIKQIKEINIYDE